MRRNIWLTWSSAQPARTKFPSELRPVRIVGNRFETWLSIPIQNFVGSLSSLGLHSAFLVLPQSQRVFRWHRLPEPVRFPPVIPLPLQYCFASECSVPLRHSARRNKLFGICRNCRLFSGLSHKSELLLRLNWGKLKNLQFEIEYVLKAICLANEPSKSCCWSLRSIHCSFGRRCPNRRWFREISRGSSLPWQSALCFDILSPEYIPAVHSSAWWRESRRIRFEPLENAPPSNRWKHWTYPAMPTTFHVFLRNCCDNPSSVETPFPFPTWITVPLCKSRTIVRKRKVRSEFQPILRRRQAWQYNRWILIANANAFLSNFQRTSSRTLKCFALHNPNQFSFPIFESLMLKAANFLCTVKQCGQHFASLFFVF